MMDRNEFLKTAGVLGIGALFVPGVNTESKMQGNGFFNKGSQSYQKIKELADLCLDGQIGFKSNILSNEVTNQVRLEVKPNNTNGFNNGQELGFYLRRENLEGSRVLFPSFVHLDGGIQTVLPEKATEILNQLEAISTGGKANIIEEGYNYVKSRRSYTNETISSPIKKSDFTLKEIEQAYMQQMLPTYLNFLRSLKPK